MVTGEDLIRFAGKLCVFAGADEVSFRAAVSRAYYGAFHVARAFIEDIGFVIPRNANAHAYLRLHLENCGHPDVGPAGTLLGSLLKNRLQADYDLEEQRFEAADFARLNVEMAHDITNKLNEAGQEPARSEVQAGIAEYQSKLSE